MGATIRNHGDIGVVLTLQYYYNYKVTHLKGNSWPIIISGTYDHIFFLLIINKPIKKLNNKENNNKKKSGYLLDEIGRKSGIL